MTCPVTMRGRSTPLDYLFFLRPVLLVPVWTIALLGTVTASPHSPLGAGRWLLLFSQLSCLAGGIYTLNQICDVESDRLNRKLHFLAGGIISPRAAWIFTAVLDLAALTGAACLGRWYFVLTVLSIGLGIVYSAGPHPWKNRPWLALGANALGHGAFVHLLGMFAVTSSHTPSWVPSLGYALAVGAVYLATTVPDMPGDQGTGKNTVAVLWGGQRTMLLATLLVLGAVVSMGVGRDWYLALAALASLPFFAVSSLKSGDDAALAAKAGVASLSIAAAVVYPFYLILLALGFLATRLFFHWRFGMTYPTLYKGK